MRGKNLTKICASRCLDLKYYTGSVAGIRMASICDPSPRLLLDAPFSPLLQLLIASCSPRKLWSREHFAYRGRFRYGHGLRSRAQ